MIYSDKAKEIKKAVDTIGAVHYTSTPHRPQSNALMERQNRSLQEGVRAVLLHSGFPHYFWPLAAQYWCAATNFTEGEQTAHGLLHGAQFNGQLVPFGMLVYFRPTDIERHSKFAPRYDPGIFIGWHLQPRLQWKGDYLVISMDALQKRSTGEIKTIPIQRIREMRILGEPQFPLADYAWAKESDPSGQESDEEPYERWTIVDDEPMSPIALEDRPRCAVCGSQEHEGSSCPQRHPSGGIAGPSSSSS